MSSFEILTPFLVLALLLATAVALYLTLLVEKRLAARKEVVLFNYRQKNHLFYITRDIPVAVFAAAVAFAALVLCTVALFHPVVRIYAVPMLLLAAVNSGACYFSLSRTKFTRDIRVFDAYYVQVEDLLANKDRTKADIDVCQKRVTELRQKLNQTIKWFNENLTEPVEEDFLPSLFAPVNAMLQDYTREIDRFSGAVEAEFNKALRAFLLEESEPELHVVPLQAFDEAAADDLIAAIKSSYGERVAEIAIAQVASGAVQSARALGNIMSLLHELGVEVDAETLGRCMNAASRFDDREEMARVLYKNGQIPAGLVRRVLIPENMEWAFTQGMVEAFNHRELTAILTDLLAADRAHLTYLFLSQFDASLACVLEAALEQERQRAGADAENEAARQASAFLLILGSEYAVGNAASIFEQLALMLYDRRTELGLNEEEEQRVAQIVREGLFLDARREIGLLYNKAVEQARPLVESCTRIFLEYVMNPPFDGSFLEPKRLSAVFGEYRFTVSLGDLRVLRALVAGYLLCTCTDVRTLSTVLAELAALPAFEPLPEGWSADKASEYGRAILTHLAQKERVRLRSALYRTESERLALDRVLALCKKEV